MIVCGPFRSLTTCLYFPFRCLQCFADGVWSLQVSEWADQDDPRWVHLWDCTRNSAVFDFVRLLLAPTPQLRIKDLLSSPFMQQSTQRPCSVTPAGVTPPLLPTWSLPPAESLSQTGSAEHILARGGAVNAGGWVLGRGVALVPVPGLPTVLWDPYNPVLRTITGLVYRYGSTLVTLLIRQN